MDMVQYPCTQTPFIVCLKKWAYFELCSKRKWIWSHVWYPGDRELTHERQCLTITSSQGLEQWNCVDASFVCEHFGYQPLKQAIQDQASSSPVPCVYYLLIDPLSTWCHAHNQHFQCDFSSCEAMKQVCYVYIVMVTGAALPLKRVQCHWCCGEVLC